MQPLTDTQSANGDYTRYILFPTGKTTKAGRPVAMVQEYKFEASWKTVPFPIAHFQPPKAMGASDKT